LTFQGPEVQQGIEVCASEGRDEEREDGDSLGIRVRWNGSHLVSEDVSWNHWVRRVGLPDAESENHGKTQCHRCNNRSRSPWTTLEETELDRLVVSTPLDSEQEQRESADREKSAEIINSRENLHFRQSRGIHSRRRPVEDHQQDERPAINNEGDPCSPSPSRRRRIQLRYYQTRSNMRYRTQH
jgi:hypothetical protein